jgi:hypothetical protein
VSPANIVNVLVLVTVNVNGMNPSRRKRSMCYMRLPCIPCFLALRNEGGSCICALTPVFHLF